MLIIKEGFSSINGFVIQNNICYGNANIVVFICGFILQNVRLYVKYFYLKS